MKTLWILLSLIICFGLQSGIQAQELISTTLAIVKTNLVAGEITIATVEVKNIQIMTPPFVLTSTATWDDTYGQSHSTSATSEPIQVIRPVTVNAISIPLPTSLTYVDASATSGGIPIATTITNGALSLTINKIIKEQESIIVTLQLKAK
jgi:hypothetical protein